MRIGGLEGLRATARCHYDLRSGEGAILMLKRCWLALVACAIAIPTAWSQAPSNACDLATPYGTIDASDVQAAINMSLGVAPCTANIAGANVCNVVVVQRVINASLGQ